MKLILHTGFEGLPSFLKGNINMLMEWNAEILRGWPNEGALERSEVIKAATTVSNGDWVEKQSDGTVAASSATATNHAGLVVRGNGDSASAAAAGKATVLWGNFVAKVSNYTAGAYVPGSPVTITSGKVALATPASGTGATYAPGDPIIGYVLDVTAAVSGKETASLVIVVR